MTSVDRRPRSQFLLRLTLELLVVFVGVYGAFALSEWQAERDAEVRREQIGEALLREVRDITWNTNNGLNWFASTIAMYDSAFAVGGTPRLIPILEPIGVQTHMWQATLESDGLELLDVKTIFELSQFYNELNAGFAQMDQLNALSESVLVPNLNRGTDEFYAPGGILRQKYAWYLQGLRRLHGIAERIVTMGDSITVRLGGERVPNDTAGAAPDTGS